VRIFLSLFIILLFSSCSKNSVDETNEAIDIALTHLSKDECDKALSVLQSAGMQSSNGIYLQVLASAHACKASFDEVQFIAADLENIDTTTAESILKSMSILTYSPETITDSPKFVSILTGINLVLDNRKQTARASKFGARKAGDMGVQALILNIVNLGKFLNFYGNVNSAGDKGLGSGGNACFLDYNDARARAIVGVTTGACVANNDGHPDLDQTTANGKRRICEGLMLITNIMDILDNLDLSASSTLSKLEDVSTQVNTFKAAAVAAGLGTLINMTSQSECVAHINVPAQLLDMEYMYALVFEEGLQ
jgi:hypothetical protein